MAHNLIPDRGCIATLVMVLGMAPSHPRVDPLRDVITTVLFHSLAVSLPGPPLLQWAQLGTAG